MDLAIIYMIGIGYTHVPSLSNPAPTSFPIPPL